MSTVSYRFSRAPPQRGQDSAIPSSLQPLPPPPLPGHPLPLIARAPPPPSLARYGQTETTAGATITQEGDFSAGHVGGPFSCTEICLKDVPEMGYRHTDTWHGADPRDGGAGGGVACDGRGEVRRGRERRLASSWFGLVWFGFGFVGKADGWLCPGLVLLGFEWF